MTRYQRLLLPPCQKLHRIMTTITSMMWGPSIVHVVTDTGGLGYCRLIYLCSSEEVENSRDIQIENVDL
jgi:hypothetical protein